MYVIEQIKYSSRFIFHTYACMWCGYPIQGPDKVAVKAEAGDTEVEDADDEEEQATTAPSCYLFLFRIRW